jgi:hypothetical protein
LRVEPLEAYHPPVRTTVASGDTIESVCRRLAGSDWVAWRDVLVDEIDPKRLFPGTEFHGTLTPSGTLERLEVVLDRRSEVHLDAGTDGISVARIERPIESEVMRLEGVVESSLFEAMDGAGGDPELAVRIAQIYQWDIDFLRDLRKGDTFVVVVDRQRRVLRLGYCLRFSLRQRRSNPRRGGLPRRFGTARLLRSRRPAVA